MNRGDSLAELPRVFLKQGSALGPALESRESEGGTSEASSHVDQLISAFEHISTQQPKTVASDAGHRRHAVQATTLKQLSEASPMKEKASLHQQLAALQEDLQAKQAQIVAQRKDLEYWQHLLQYAAGAARREVLELRAHKERAATALAAAQQQITDLTSALAEAGAVPAKSHVASTQEDQGESAMLYGERMQDTHMAQSEATSGELSLPGTPQRSAVSLQEAAAVTRSQAARHRVQGHTVSVSLLSDSEDEHRPEEAISSPAVHVHLRVQQPEQPASEQQLRSQLLEQQQLCEALQSRAAQLEAELGAKEAQRAALLAEVALLRSLGAKAEQRIGVLESEVVALMAQAEQSSYEHELALKEIERLTVRGSGESGAAASATKPVHDELAAAQQRLKESSAEVQRLTAVAASCREELEQVKLSQVEAGRQAENDRDAREALWQKLQEANQKLSNASRDALGREAELEQRLGMAEYGQQMAEVQSSELHAKLQQHGSMLQDVQVLAIAASAAATGAAAQAVAERDSVYVDFGSLAEDMLAVQDSLQAFSRKEDGSLELPAEAAPLADTHSSSPEQCTPRPRPCTAPAVSKELSSSSCSSISFTKGIATWGNSAPEVSSEPPTTLHGAQSARKWLDGQISPPRHLAAPLRVRNPAAITLPLLMPPAMPQEGRPTPRLAQPDSQRTSAENPLLLIETPVGGAERGPSWNMDLPKAAPANSKRWAASCPTTPNTAFLKASRPHTVARAGLIQSAKAPAGRAQEDAEMRRNAKRQLFAQAADLAADLARLRKRIQDRLQQLPACSNAELSQLQGCSAANSGAMSLSSYCSQGTESVVAASPSSRPGCDVSSTMGVLRRNASQSGHPSGDLALREETSAPQAATLSREPSPDLASMPPRIQRIAQMALLSKSAGAVPCAVESPQEPHAVAATNDASASVGSTVSAEPEALELISAPQAIAPTSGSTKAPVPRRRKPRHLIRSLVALPVLAVAFVAHPGLAGCCAAAAATLVGKTGQGSNLRARSQDTSAVRDSTQSGRGERKARIYG